MLTQHSPEVFWESVEGPLADLNPGHAQLVSVPMGSLPKFDPMSAFLNWTPRSTVTVSKMVTANYMCNTIAILPEHNMDQH